VSGPSMGAGCPAAVESPGVRSSLVFLCLVAPDVRAPAGCPAAVAPRRQLHLFKGTFKDFYATSSFQNFDVWVDIVYCFACLQGS
jgi:hypothetical protein